MSAGPIRFGLLGPFEVEMSGAVLDLGGQRQQTVLATLALAPNRTVGADRLIATVYGADPPSTGKGADPDLRIGAAPHVRRTRHPDLITTRPAGYALRVADDDIDLRRFETTVAEGRAVRDSRPPEAITVFRAALAWWRGPALGGLDSAAMRAIAHRLDEQRLGVTEECLDLELSLGRHREALVELTTLAAEHPLREQLQGQLMLALYRSGRAADALDVYQRARRTLVDELGIEPGIRLQRLHRAILAGSTSLDIAPAPTTETREAAPEVTQPVPRLLPTDIADFTGREAEIRAIEAALTGDGDPGVVPIVAVSGRPGVGKTALAVRAGHRVAGRYADGQLFADLRGPSGRPADPAEILGRFLRVLLGRPALPCRTAWTPAPSCIGTRWPAAARSSCSTTPATKGQILPLVPGAAPCAVLVTGRPRFGGLPGTAHIAGRPVRTGHRGGTAESHGGHGPRRGRAGTPPRRWPACAATCRSRCASRAPGWSAGPIGGSSTWRPVSRTRGGG